MEWGRFIYYFNLFLKIILVILVIYCAIVAYQFFNWFSNQQLPPESVRQICNEHAALSRDYGYCCEQYQVFHNSQLVGSSCYGLRQHNVVSGIQNYECGGVTCQT